MEHRGLKYMKNREMLRKERSFFYVMHQDVIEATPRTLGRPSQEIYLAGDRLKYKAMLTGGVADGEILKLLETCEGMLKLVHSIGVAVESDTDREGIVHFVYQNWGKQDIYNSGTCIRIPCPKDGTEVNITFEDQLWSPDDDVPGKIAFEFDRPGEIAKATVKFYLNDGYEVPEPVNEPPVDFASDEYKHLIARSLMSMGNNKRLKAAIDKAKRGEDVTIAYIGGSITQGACAKPINTGCYAYRSYLLFKRMFGPDGGRNIHFIKAGVGGTPSELGVVRYDRDILRDGAVKPDIVIIEFGVNDNDDETKGACYESLCLKALSADNKPAVILLFSVFYNDWNLQDRLAPVGWHYCLPMVSIKDAVVDQFRLTKSEGNIISKRQYFYDIYHPTNDGHTLMADCLAYLFAMADKAEMAEKDISLDVPPVIGNDFKDIRLLDRITNTDAAIVDMGGFSEKDTELQLVEMDADLHGTPQFPNNWMHTSNTGNESFRMSIESRSLILVFKDSGSPEFGKADIFVDGCHVRTADPHIINWTHCNAILLYREQALREHTVEIRMAQGDEGKCFTILGFGYSV